MKKLIIFLFLFSWSTSSFGESVHLGWAAPVDDRITGYEVHYGPASGTYTEVEQAPGNTTEEAIFDVPSGTWYFAARAHTEYHGLYSPFSNEVSAFFGEYGLPVEITNTSISYKQDEEPEVATVTRTVAASGGDHTTIAAALSWFVSNHNFNTDGIARIQITDTSSYTISSSLTLNGISGTPAIDAYLEVTSNASDPFSGPTINCTHSSSGCLHVDVDFTYIHNLIFHLNNTSASTECIRVLSGADNVLLSRNVFIALNQTSDQDGIYTGNWPVSNLRIDNNVLLGFARSAIHLQNYGGGVAQTADTDFNSIGASSISGETEGGAIHPRVHTNVDSTVDVSVYNTLAYDYKDASSVGRFSTTDPAPGNVTWSGSNNIADDTSAESRFTSSYDSVTLTESSPSSGENAWLTEIDNADETLIDLSIAGENAYTVTGNGVSRVGSEPDPRQDFSIDIMGNARHATTPDIGAFEYVPEGAATSFTPPQMQKLFTHLLVR